MNVARVLHCFHVQGCSGSPLTSVHHFPVQEEVMEEFGEMPDDAWKGMLEWSDANSDGQVRTVHSHCISELLKQLQLHEFVECTFAHPRGCPPLEEIIRMTKEVQQQAETV